MSIFLRVAMSADTEEAILRHVDRPERFLQSLSDNLQQGLSESEAHMQTTYLSGGDFRQKRDGKAPLATRTGSLLRSTVAKLSSALSGFIGIRRGPASRYAQTVLGDEETTIKPKDAENLWIPIADNLTNSGVTRMTPTEAFSKVGPRGGQLLSIFESKNGNMLAFLRDPSGASYKRGKRKGLRKGKLLFVLKKEVTVKGINALERTIEDKRQRFLELFGESTAEIA